MIVTVEEIARVPFEDVLPGKNGGASPRGSTYWGRVQSCPREHLLGNLMRWEPVPRAHALDFGLLWHHLLESYYTTLQLNQRGVQTPFTPDRVAFSALQPFRDPPGWGEIYEKTSVMLDGYLTRWRNADQYLEILGVETQLGVDPQGNFFQLDGFPQTSRLDGVVKDWSGQAPVGRHLEHKSAWRMETNLLVGYSQDDQVLGQCYLGHQLIDWRKYGVYYAGALVNITTKTKDPSNERVPVNPSYEQLHEFVRSKRYWHRYAQMLERGDEPEEEQFPKNFTKCVRRYGRCGYFDYCRNHPTDTLVQIRKRDASNDLPQGFRKRDFIPEEG